MKGLVNSEQNVITISSTVKKTTLFTHFLVVKFELLR